MFRKPKQYQHIFKFEPGSPTTYAIDHEEIGKPTLRFHGLKVKSISMFQKTKPWYVPSWIWTKVHPFEYRVEFEPTDWFKT